MLPRLIIQSRFAMTNVMRSILFLTLFACLFVPPPESKAQGSGDVIKVGIFTDMEGIYSSFTGTGSVIAAQMAIDDVGGKINGKPIKLLVADHKNDVQTAVAIARQWLEEEKVDVIADFVGSPMALAVQELNQKRQAVLIFNSVVTTAVTGKNCSATGIHWMYDAHSYAAVIGGAITRRGANSWFFITVDNAFGANTEKQFTEFVTANGGKVLGSAKHPLNTEDFSYYLLKAQASGADVIAFINAGEDASNGIKQAFDLRSVAKRETIATAFLGIAAIHAIKLPLSQGLQLHTSFYWNLDAKTAAWSRRYFALRGEMPHDVQAGIYSSLTHYFKAVKATGDKDGPTVVRKMRELPIDGTLVRNAKLREDGRMVHDVYLVQVKKPGESAIAWDYFNVLQTIPADQAFRPIAKSDCPLLKKN